MYTINIIQSILYNIDKIKTKEIKLNSTTIVGSRYRIM